MRRLSGSMPSCRASCFQCRIFRSAFHFRQQIVSFFACPLAPGNLLARLIALGLAAFNGSNAFTTLPIESAETFEIDAYAAVCGHFVEFWQVLAKIVEIMHGRTEYRNLTAQETHR